MWLGYCKVIAPGTNMRELCIVTIKTYAPHMAQTPVVLPLSPSYQEAVGGYGQH